MVCWTNGLHTTLYRWIHIADLRLLFDSVLAATLTSPEPVEFCPVPYVHPRTASARHVSERTAPCTTSNELLLLPRTRTRTTRTTRTTTTRTTTITTTTTTQNNTKQNNTKQQQQQQQQQLLLLLLLSQLGFCYSAIASSAQELAITISNRYSSIYPARDGQAELAWLVTQQHGLLGQMPLPISLLTGSVQRNFY